jgi:muramoyltetrapeptide carboxypeptidase
MARLNLAARHKTYLGYSDMGYLLAGLYRHKIGRPVHGPMVADGRRAGGEDALRRALDWLSGGREGLEPSLAEEAHPVAAFNLTTLAMLAGTPLMPGLAGHVVMVEEVSEYLYAVDRLFFHATAHLAGIAGLRLGRVSDVPENERPFGASALDIAKDWCGRHAIPFLGRRISGMMRGTGLFRLGEGKREGKGPSPLDPVTALTCVESAPFVLRCEAAGIDACGAMRNAAMVARRRQTRGCRG